MHPVLVYHELAKSRGTYQYAISDSDFADHLHVLHENNYTCVSVDEYYRYIKEKEALASKIIALTFDDGHESNFNSAFPTLAKYGFKATFFITTDWIRKPGYMDENQLKTLVEKGMSVQSHTKTHSFLNEMNYDEIYSELQQSKATLEKITQREVGFLSLPGGRYNKEVVRCAADLKYAAVFTSMPFYFKSYTNVDLIGRYVLRHSGGKMYIENVIRANYFDIFKLKILKNLKDLTKKTIGNNLYHFLWKKYVAK